MTDPTDEEKYIVKHARALGIEKYSYTQLEYQHLRETALHLHFNSEFLEDFDKNYKFVHDLARNMMTGAINSMTGMCYDIALRNYDKEARTVEKWTAICEVENTGRADKVVSPE